MQPSMPFVTDMHGLPVTGASEAAAQALDLFGHEWLVYGNRVGEIITTAYENKQVPLVQVYAAVLHMALEARSGYAAAAPFLHHANTYANGVTAREFAILKAAQFWHADRPLAALHEFECALSISPNDLVAAKWGQYLAFNLGDRDAMLRLAHQVMPHHSKTAEAWGMLAFAQEQTHQLDNAEQSARIALELKPAEPWAQHALAHVYETRGELDAGIDFLTNAAPSWSDRSIFIREHNYWHLALLHLDRDEPEKTLQIFDQHLWGEWPEFAQEQIGAISMIWRLKLRGVEIGNRLHPVIQKVMERGSEHLWPFHDLHFVFALAHSDDPKLAARFIDRMAVQLEQRSIVWRRTALPTAKAILAHAQKDYQTAAELLGQVLPNLHEIGGSHAQRDVFVQTWLDANLRANNFTAVEQALEARCRARPRVERHRREWSRKHIQVTSGTA